MKSSSVYVIAFMAGSSLADSLQQHPFIHPMIPYEQQNVTIHGKYLHITDIHMDKHYLTGATINSDCHRLPNKHRKKKKEQGLLAGYWGAPGMDCDAPQKLVYHSIDYIAKEWKDQIDFILWTGDNARHDGDPYITRTKKEIVGYNIKVADLLKNAFRLDNNRTVPIVPCIGNNDIHPHNELRGMKKNPQLLEFSQMWGDFIPSQQLKAFRRGGYFAVDVVPGIRVLSLNTLYFFGSNDVVNSCSDSKSPGAKHIKWMRSQLKRARKEGVKVLVIGHVPPTVKTFKDSCLDDYIKLSTKFADVITGHMYGHANMDHFQILSRGFTSSTSYNKDMVLSPVSIGEVKETAENGDDDDMNSLIEIQKDSGRFIASLRKQYKKVKKVRKTQDLVVIHVAPPMIPLFYPTFRVNEYQADKNSPQFGDWLKYTQWYTNLTYWNEARDPITKKHLEPQFEIEYSTDETYNMTDLTPNSWLDFAERISTKKEKKGIWKVYLSNMFVRTTNQWYGQSVPVQEPTLTWKDWAQNIFHDIFHF